MHPLPTGGSGRDVLLELRQDCCWPTRPAAQPGIASRSLVFADQRGDRITGIRELPISGNRRLIFATSRRTLCVMPVRLRVAKLLEKRGLTAYQLAKESGGAISTTQAYRLTSPTPTAFPPSFATIEALCDLLDVKPGDLFERTNARRSR